MQIIIGGMKKTSLGTVMSANTNSGSSNHYTERNTAALLGWTIFILVSLFLPLY